MPRSPLTSAPRQCLRLCHSHAPSRTRPSVSKKTLNQSLSTTSNSKPYVCLFASPAQNCRPSPSSRRFSIPRPACPWQCWSFSRFGAPYSTSPPFTAPESLSAEQYHQLADSYIDSLLVHLEQLQEERDDVDCEYSVRSIPPTSRATSP